MHFQLWPETWLVAFVSLTGCAGGGGGGSGDNPPNGLKGLTQLTALSVVSNSATFNNPPTHFTSTPAAVAISVAGNGSAITMVDVNVTGLFDQTFNSSTFVPQTDPSGAIALFSATVTAPDLSVRQLLFANPGYALFSLTYTTLGFWEYDLSAAAPSGVGGAYAAGFATRTSDLPATGTAQYKGGMIGRYADGTTSWAVAASASSIADFGAHTLSLSTSSSFKAQIGGPAIPDSSLNLLGTFTFPPGTNQLTGTVTSVGGMTGASSAKFFGPNAQELGGTYFITDGANHQMVGAFGLHR